MPSVPSRQETARLVLLAVLIFFLYISPDSPTSGSKLSQETAVDNVNQYKNLLATLNSSRWQGFNPQRESHVVDKSAKYLNLTGFRQDDGYQGWGRLGKWKERCMLFFLEAHGRSQKGKEPRDNAFYTNITGIVQGKWVRYEADLIDIDRKLWPKINISKIAPGVKWDTENIERWTRNITGGSGKIRLRLEENESEIIDLEPKDSREDSIGSVREITATITLYDDSNKGNGWVMRTHGVYWPKVGVLLMTTTSEKFAGIFGLPHLTLDLEQYVSSQRLLNRTLGKALDNPEKNPGSERENMWVMNSEDGEVLMTPHCEFVVFAQVYPFEVDRITNFGDKKTTLIIQEIERELRAPNGAPTPRIPMLKMSTVILSPDCGFILESKGPPSFTFEDGDHLTGKKHEVLVRNMQHLLEGFAVVILAQTLLLVAQSKDASTPSTIERISLFTISFMLFADAFIFAILSLMSGVSPNLFPSALLVSFMSFMSVMLGIRFLSAIWNSQEPERIERLRQQRVLEAATQPSSELNITQVNSPNIDTNITSSTSVRPQEENPIIIPSDQDIDAEIFEDTLNSSSSLLPTTNENRASTQATSQPRGVSFATIYVRSVLLLTFILFFTLSSTSWPARLRKMYIFTLSLINLSFPSFQIYRNVQRNCRKALLWKFIIGQSILRMAPFAYFYLIEDNILFSETDLKAFSVLAGWVWIQCWTLVAQSILGPRWGLPKNWYVEGWNYHPILRNENLEASGLPIGLTIDQDASTFIHTPTSTSSLPGGQGQGQLGKMKNSFRSVDCAICMQVLEVPIIKTDGDTTASGVAEILESRRYMVTPCRHIFHSKCLEGWMQFRLQCPICRDKLPPL
ncbi:Transmembrane E3 ubiquitin-protein ligase 1 [Golovinomyces cichoracearum]|uniref:DSC E3 ubiquitin ligase complex subunit A n=1 Tax=Golovinomyces cichoracearum TaxID=62708 RepID=A0A420IE61_9PEZI|nr:Transmembrane E3 ubiquitin-protein ligase 1 [Golovinomyces cichoracearum]